MRVPRKYICSGVRLLEEIAAEGKFRPANRWQTSVGDEDDEQATLGERLEAMHQDAYEQGFVIPNYRDIWERCCADKHIRDCTDEAVGRLTEEEALAGISMIYRGDRFCEGLLDECIGDGTLLRFYRRLMALATAEMEAAEPDHVRCPLCGSIHTAPVEHGMAVLAEQLERDEADERVVHWGCCVNDGDPTHWCFACEKGFVDMLGMSPRQEAEALNRAIAFAAERHGGQLRKGTTMPYIVHPMEVVSILAGMKADVSLLMAGALHDTMEDAGVTQEELQQRFGEDAAALVAGATEDKAKSWQERKQAAIDALKTAPLRLKMLVLADKVANLRAMYAEYRLIGDALWQRFNAPVERQAWYFSAVQDALADMLRSPCTEPVYWEMGTLLKELFVRFWLHEDRLYQVCQSGEAYQLRRGRALWEPFGGSVPKKARRIDRKEAERLEEDWSDPFWQAVERDLTDSRCQLHDGAARLVEAVVREGALSIDVTDTGEKCRAISGGDVYEYHYALDAEATRRVMVLLRQRHGLRLHLDTILRREFGGDQGPKQFADFCSQARLQYRFFAH